MALVTVERKPCRLADAKRLTRAALDRPWDVVLADDRASFATVMTTASARTDLTAARPPRAIQNA